MEGDRVLIRVGFMDASKIYCDVDLKNLTKASFLNDGNLRSNIRVLYCVLCDKLGEHFFQFGSLCWEIISLPPQRHKHLNIEAIFVNIFFVIVAEVAEIEENAEIKIFDNEDVEVPLRHLKRVIKKYEKSIRFSLRIEPLNSGDWMDQHAVDMLKVCI